MSTTALGTAASALPPLHPGLGITFAEGSVAPEFTSLDVTLVVDSRSEVTSLDTGSLSVDPELSGNVAPGETEDGAAAVVDAFADVTAGALVVGFMVPDEALGPTIEVAGVVIDPTLEVTAGVSDVLVSLSPQPVAAKTNPKRGATETSEEQ